MTKREIVIASSGFVLAIAIVSGGLGWHQLRTNNNKLARKATQTVGDHTISLNEANKTEDSGGLSVSSNANDSMGQLNDKTGKGSSSGSGGSSGASSSGGSSFDPSTFAQYDKYKTATSAMFAEVEKGTGKELTPNAKAVVVYKGWLTNGTLFDESKVGSDGKTQAFSFTMGAHEVIPGWEQAMNGMKTGGIRLLVIPPSVGYGAAGQGPIPGNAVLVFAVKLVAVQ